MNYKLRTQKQLLKDLNLLLQKKRKIVAEYEERIKDIEADAKVIELELKLLDTMGKIS